MPNRSGDGALRRVLFSVRIGLLSVVQALWLLPVAAQLPTSYQEIYEVEDPCFEFLSGAWNLDKTGSFFGSFYYSIPGPGSGNAKGRWIAEGLPNGTYTIEFYADYGDYPADARYQVIHADGVADLQINMNYQSAGWHALGSFDCNGVCVVNISDYWTGAGTKLSVDALRFTLTTTLPSPPATSVPPHIGICIDDSGQVNPTSSTTPIYKMLRLGFPLTFAVMPYQSYTDATANEVYARGSEVILHEPMAAVSVPNPGAGGITDAMTLDQVRTTVATNLDNLPHVVGMNNHMGSLITQQTDKMTVCMEELKARNLFFYDSRTITTTVGYDVAMANGLLTAERDLFIDDTVEGTKARVRSFAVQALYAPEVPWMAIGHVRANTADGLAQIVPELQAMGVEIWPISRCIHQVIETDRQPSGADFTSTGTWVQDTAENYSRTLWPGHSLRLDNPAATHADEAMFTPALMFEGDYDVYAIWPADAANSSQLRARISAAYGTQIRTFDESIGVGQWWYLGRFPCQAGNAARIAFDDFSATTTGRVFRAEAVRYEYRGPVSVPSGVQGWLMY